MVLVIVQYVVIVAFAFATHQDQQLNSGTLTKFDRYLRITLRSVRSTAQGHRLHENASKVTFKNIHVWIRNPVKKTMFDFSQFSW